jgi:hypothetical protein
VSKPATEYTTWRVAAYGQKRPVRPKQIPHMTCMIPHMKSSATNPPFDLLKLYKDRKVKRISTFAEVAGQLDPAYLVAAYDRARDSAPRRHDHNRNYFVDHSGPTNRAEKSNRGEEHLALALWGASQSDDPMVLPTGATLEILDYQTPLKAQQRDTGVGKVDLFGLIDGCRSTVIELKVSPTTSGYGDTPLHAYLEALAYCAIIEANASEIASEARTRLDKSIDDQPPGLIVMAPQDYWAGYLEHPSAGEWWPILSRLAAEIGKLLNLETHFLSLRDAEFRMGAKDQDPQLIGHCSVVSVNELTGD